LDHFESDKQWFENKMNGQQEVMERCGLLDLLENPEALEAVSLGYVGSMVIYNDLHTRNNQNNPFPLIQYDIPPESMVDVK